MKMLKRAVKGTYGYIQKKRVQTALITAMMFIISIGIIITGYVTTGSKKNLLTIVGILGLLPASKSLVSLIMLLRAGYASSGLYEKISSIDDSLVSMYDMYFTSYKKNFAISHMVVNDGVIIGYSEDMNFDQKGCQGHLENMLKSAGHKKFTVCLSVKEDEYIDMIKKLNEKAKDNKNIESDDSIRISLYEIVL